MRRLAFLLAGLLACSRTGGAETEISSTIEPSSPTTPLPAMKPPTPKAPPPAAPHVTVEMTAATLADDCGDVPPASPPAQPVVPAPPGPRAKEARSQRDEPDATSGGRARGVGASGYYTPCEPTAMQLAVTSPQGALPAAIAVKKVELFDENGTLIGTLASRSPTVWDASAYAPWDQKVASGAQLSVSYVLAPPSWRAIGGRRAVVYTLKAEISVGGADQTLTRDVQVKAIATRPPNIRT